MRHGAAACALLSALVWTAGARAQQGGDRAAELRDEEARSLFRAGSMAYGDGRFDEALEHFRRAYELSERPELLYNIGSAAERAGEARAALEAFEQYLQELPDADNRSFVESRMRVLREQLEGEEPRDAPSAPTPEQAAEAAPPNARATGGLRATTETGSSSRREDSVVSEWWLWTIVGALAVGGALTAALVLTKDRGGGGSFADSDLGRVVRTLGGR